ncbi:MAG: hypothetical protein Q8R63_03205 [Ramlibacter sp.]|nr:hypothetical protein [Ramlibacter sp.]
MPPSTRRRYAYQTQAIHAPRVVRSAPRRSVALFVCEAARFVAGLVGRIRAGQAAPRRVQLAIPDSLVKPLERQMLRDYFTRMSNGADVEFLIAYWSFTSDRNGLQRFEQFRTIIDRFVRDNAVRPVSLTPACRVVLLADWVGRSGAGRIAANEPVLALEAAVLEILAQVQPQGSKLPWASRRPA